MKLTVIGYWGAYPGKNEATSCFLLEEDGTKILLDCGSGAVAKLQNYTSLTDISAVVISHYHHDHVADVGALTYSRVVDMNLNHTDIPLQIFAHDDDSKAFQKLGKAPFANVTKYDESTPVVIGPFTISFQKTKHPAPCYAMKIQSSASDKVIVYTADTAYEESLVPFSSKADLLIAETSFYEGQDAASFGHMNSNEVAHLAEKANSRVILISHLPHFGEHRKLADQVRKVFHGHVHLAHTGQQIHL